MAGGLIYKELVFSGTVRLKLGRVGRHEESGFGEILRQMLVDRRLNTIPLVFFLLLVFLLCYHIDAKITDQ